MLSAGAPVANAQTFSGTYTFGADGNVASFAYNGDPISGLTVSNIHKVGVNTSSSSGNFRATQWPLGATDGSNTFVGMIDPAKYIEFSLAAAPGKLIRLPTITFGLGRSTTGPRQWQWRSSVDGYANPIPVTTVNGGVAHDAGVVTVPDNTTAYTGNVISTSGGAYLNLSSITFRLYGYNAEGTTGTAGLQGNLTFGGTLVDDGGPTDTTDPVIVSLAPENNATGVLPNTNLSITFDETITSGTGSLVIRKSLDDSVVETITVPSTKVTSTTVNAIINPDALLDYNTSYYVEVTAGAFTDLSANPSPAISGANTWNFTTRDGPPPILISQYYEGASNDKYIELKNLTGFPLSLDGYRLVAWGNEDREAWKTGMATSMRVSALTGTIPANGYYLLAQSGVVAPPYAAGNFDQSAPSTNSAAAFNGDDSIVLYAGTGFTLDEVVDAVSFVANNGEDKSFYRLNDSPGFDFDSGSSILNYSGVWGVKTLAEVESADFNDPWYLRASSAPSASNTFANWIDRFDVGLLTGFKDDFDNDGLPNALENILGSDPSVANQGLTAVSVSAGNLKFQHTLAAQAELAADLAYEYEWSVNLADWQASGVEAGGTTVTFGTPVVITPSTEGAPDRVEVTATVTGSPAATSIFARLRVNQVPAS